MGASIPAKAAQNVILRYEQVISFNKIPLQKWLVSIVGATHGSINDPISTAQREGNGEVEVVGERTADIRKSS